MKSNSKAVTPSTWVLILAVFGPGLVVMFADTDASSIITAAQSGAQWGYRLLLLNIILIPVLFITQELTVRLGIATRMGHGELIKHYFGKFWAWVSVSTLIISCIGAMLSEFTGIAGVGALFGVPIWLSLTITVLFLSVIALTGSYRSVERIALLFGLFELVFFYVAWRAHPSGQEIWEHMSHIPIHNPQYLYLAAANIGAVIMPWMIFYQQSAVVDKGLLRCHLKIARWDTAIGAIVTQLIMVAILVAVAATIGKKDPGASLENVQHIASALTPFLGKAAGTILFALGMTGAAFIAAIVVSLTAAWGLGEITGFKHSLEHHPKEAPWFYATYIIILIAGAILVGSGINLVNLSVAVNVLNAFLLPIVLSFLYLISLKALPPEYKMSKNYAIVIAVILGSTAILGVWGGISGL